MPSTSSVIFVSINSSSDNIVSIDKYHSISIIFINCYHIFLSRAEETTAGCCALPESRDRIKVGVLLMMLLLFLLVWFVVGDEDDDVVGNVDVVNSDANEEHFSNPATARHFNCEKLGCLGC